ncbi:MAG TPA: hypothetical protein VGH86_02770 [Phenylobacterium sp.]|jgi:hypothetical protein
MVALQYILTLESIILGLAIGDLAKSLHTLLRARKRVRWDWLAPLTAIMITVKIANHWWSWYRFGPVASRLTFEMLLGIMATTILLYLVSAAALPDDAREQEVDLRVHYERTAPRLWITFIAYGLLTSAINLWMDVKIPSMIQVYWPLHLVTPVAATLLVVRNRWWHGAFLVGVIVIYIWQFFGKTLGA